MINKVLVFICVFLIRFYQLTFSLIKGHSCRFEPTCSEYAKDAFLLHGVRKGAILTLKRLLKCHPWGKSGFDPVPRPIQIHNNKRKEK